MSFNRYSWPLSKDCNNRYARLDCIILQLKYNREISYCINHYLQETLNLFCTSEIFNIYIFNRLCELWTKKIFLNVVLNISDVQIWMMVRFVTKGTKIRIYRLKFHALQILTFNTFLMSFSKQIRCWNWITVSWIGIKIL